MPNVVVTHKTVVPGFEGSQEETLSYETRVEVSPISIANGVTDQVINIAIDVSQVVAFWLKSSVAMTFETNSGSAADNTITLVANKPYLWRTSQYDTFKLTVDVTKIYLTNASGGSGTFELLALYGDATP